MQLISGSCVCSAEQCGCSYCMELHVIMLVRVCTPFCKRTRTCERHNYAALCVIVRLLCAGVFVQTPTRTHKRVYPPVSRPKVDVELARA